MLFSSTISILIKFTSLKALLCRSESRHCMHQNSNEIRGVSSVLWSHWLIWFEMQRSWTQYEYRWTYGISMLPHTGKQTNTTKTTIVHLHIIPAHLTWHQIIWTKFYGRNHHRSHSINTPEYSQHSKSTNYPISPLVRWLHTRLLIRFEKKINAKTT